MTKGQLNLGFPQRFLKCLLNPTWSSAFFRRQRRYSSKPAFLPPRKRKATCSNLGKTQRSQRAVRLFHSIWVWACCGCATPKKYQLPPYYPQTTMKPSNKIRIASWNIETITPKTAQIAVVWPRCPKLKQEEVRTSQAERTETFPEHCWNMLKHHVISRAKSRDCRLCKLPCSLDLHAGLPKQTICMRC